MNLNFGCTQCGRCCHGLRLPLSVDESLVWLSQGNGIQVLCEAIPWPAEPPAGDFAAEYKRQRSFPAYSGSMPVRVLVTLVASFEGDCPNLTASGQCGIYEQRPAVCRIYPAEIHPYHPLVPSAKACPPEAWRAEQPVFMRADRLVDTATLALIDHARHTAELDVAMKARLCAQLDIRVAAFANEGYAVHAPEPAIASQAFELVRCTDESVAPHHEGWQFLSNNAELNATLKEIGAEVASPETLNALGVGYLNRRPNSTTVVG